MGTISEDLYRTSIQVIKHKSHFKTSTDIRLYANGQSSTCNSNTAWPDDIAELSGSAEVVYD